MSQAHALISLRCRKNVVPREPHDGFIGSDGDVPIDDADVVQIRQYPHNDRPGGNKDGSRIHLTVNQVANRQFNLRMLQEFFLKFVHLSQRIKF